MLGWLRRIMGDRQTLRASDFCRRQFWLRSRYDAAATTDNNRRHWLFADGLSANAANNPQVRRTLRNRARYEVANNSYARGIALTLANDVIGTGPRLQLLSEDPVANRRIEREFWRWAKMVRLAETLRTMRQACAEDGEAFAIFTSNDRLPGAIKLDLRSVEADQITTPELLLNNPAAVDGIVCGGSGRIPHYRSGSGK